MVTGRLPVNLLGVCVEVNGSSAPLIDVFPGQVNAVMPALSAGANSAQVRLIRECGRTTQMVSPPETVPYALRAPEFLHFAGGSGGERPLAAVSAENGDSIGPRSLGAIFRPARIGEIVTAFATGFGSVLPAVLPGAPAPAAANIDGRAILLLGGIPVPAAEVFYVGIAPGFFGLYQVNFRVPATAPDGSSSLVIQVDGVTSPPGTRIAVQR